MAKRGRRFESLTIATKSLTDQSKRIRAIERTLNDDSKKMKLVLGENMPATRNDVQWNDKTGMAGKDHPYWLMKKNSEMFNRIRNTDLRDTARSTYLALAFLLGREYSTIENKRKDSVAFERYIFPEIVKRAFDQVLIEFKGDENSLDNPAIFQELNKDIYAWCEL